MRKRIVLVALAVAMALTVAATANADSRRYCNYDGSSSWQVCITINYTIGSYNGYPTVIVQNFQAQWNNADPTVSISNGVINAQVLGVDTSGTNWGAHETYNVSYPSSGVTYTFTPSWAGHALKTIVYPWYTYGWATAQLHRGGSNWNLTSQYACAPYSTGSPYSPC